MRKSSKYPIFVLFCLLVAHTAYAVPLTYSFTGNLNNVGSVQLFRFNAVGVFSFANVNFADVTFETFASDGGTNAAGRVFNPPITNAGPSMVDELSEGFQPGFWLFNAAGGLVDNFLSFLPSNNKPGTDLLVNRLLFPGSYTLALTNDINTVPLSDRLSIVDPKN